MVSSSGQAPGRWLRVRPLRALEVVLVGLLSLNALDVVAMSDPMLGSQSFPRPTPAVFQLQQILLYPLAFWAIGRAPTFWRQLTRLPVPRPILAVVMCVWLVEVGHFVARREVFPFSHVGMFSFLAHAGHEFIVLDRLVIVHPDGRKELISLRREGDPMFSKYLNLPPHVAWAYKQQIRDPRVLRRLRDALAARGLPPPRLARVRYVSGTGHILDVKVEPLRKEFEQ